MAENIVFKVDLLRAVACVYYMVSEVIVFFLARILASKEESSFSRPSVFLHLKLEGLKFSHIMYHPDVLE